MKSTAKPTVIESENCIEYEESEHSERLSHATEPLEIAFDKAYEDAPTKLSVTAFEKQIADHLAEPFARTEFDIDILHESESHFFLTTALQEIDSYEELVEVLSAVADYAWEHPGGCWLHVKAIESDHHTHVVATIIP